MYTYKDVAGVRAIYHSNADWSMVNIAYNTFSLCIYKILSHLTYSAVLYLMCMIIAVYIAFISKGLIT